MFFNNIRKSHRDCIHCLRDKLEPRKHLPLDLFNEILDQACSLGIRHISLTGGEPSLNPALAEMLVAISERKITFSIVSNGKEFKQKTLPVLLEPTVKKYLERYPELEDVREEIDDALIDLSESGLKTHIKGKNLDAIKFHLERKGKGRGYVKQTEVAGVQDKPINLKIVPATGHPEEEG